MLALADGTPPPSAALTQLREIRLEIEAKKDAYRSGAVDRARTAMAELGERDPAGLAALVAEFGRKGGD